MPTPEIRVARPLARSTPSAMPSAFTPASFGPVERAPLALATLALARQHVQTKRCRIQVRTKSSPSLAPCPAPSLRGTALAFGPPRAPTGRASTALTRGPSGAWKRAPGGKRWRESVFGKVPERGSGGAQGSAQPREDRVEHRVPARGVV